MANRKKRSSRRRRYSIRGASGSNILKGALIGAAGAIVAQKVAKAVLPAEQAAYTNYAVGAIGLAAAMFVSNPMVAAAGAGAVTVSAYHIGNDLVDGQGAVNLLPYGDPAVRIAERRVDTPAGPVIVQ